MVIRSPRQLHAVRSTAGRPTDQPSSGRWSSGIGFTVLTMQVIEEIQVRVVPANEVPWEDLQAVFGTADAGQCQCQRFKIRGWIWRDSTLDERMTRLQEQTACGTPDAASTSGLVAYVDGEP